LTHNAAHLVTAFWRRVYKHSRIHLGFWWKDAVDW